MLHFLTFSASLNHILSNIIPGGQIDPVITQFIVACIYTNESEGDKPGWLLNKKKSLSFVK